MTTQEKTKVDRSVKSRWTPKLAKRFCPVASVFLERYSELGLNSSDAMLVVHLFDYKWDERNPYPSVDALSKRMDLKPRTIRAQLKKLEDLNLVKRVRHTGRRNQYDLTGLFENLERFLQ